MVSINSSKPQRLLDYVHHIEPKNVLSTMYVIRHITKMPLALLKSIIKRVKCMIVASGLHSSPDNDPPFDIDGIIVRKSFIEKFTISGSIHLATKRIVRLLSPQLVMKEFNIISRTDKYGGTLVSCKYNGEPINVLILPKVPHLDGVIFANRKVGDILTLGDGSVLPIYSSTTFTSISSEGQGKGHIVIVHNRHLPKGVDIVISDPKPEIKYKDPNTIYMGVECPCHVHYTCNLDLQTIVNFLSSVEAINTVVKRGIEYLSSISATIPNINADRETMDNFISRDPSPIGRIMNLWRKKFSMPMFPFLINVVTNITKNKIMECTGKSQRGWGITIPVKGFALYPKVDPTSILDPNHSIVADIEKEIGKPVMVTPLVSEPTDAIIVRQPNSVGEFFEITLVPDTYFRIPKRSPVAFSSPSTIVKFMNILADGDQDDRVLVVTDPEIIKLWNRNGKPMQPQSEHTTHTKPKTEFTDISTFNNSTLEMVQDRSELQYLNIGFVTNAVMMATIIKNDPYLSKANSHLKAQIDDILSVSTSHILDVNKGSKVLAQMDHIHTSVETFYNDMEVPPAIFGIISRSENGFIPSVIRSFSRPRCLKPSIFDKKGYPVDYFSKAFTQLFVAARSVMQKINSLAWKIISMESDHPRSYAKIAATSPLLTPYDTDTGTKFGNVTLFKDGSFDCKPNAFLTQFVRDIETRRRKRQSNRTIILDVIVPILKNSDDQSPSALDNKLKQIFAGCVGVHYRRFRMNATKVINVKSVNDTGQPDIVSLSTSNPIDRARFYLNNTVVGVGDNAAAIVLTSLIIFRLAGRSIDRFKEILSSPSQLTDILEQASRNYDGTQPQTT